MKIAVIGAGIAGITCAYEFARDGHAVNVFEQASAAAVAASFANTGILSPSLAPHMSHPTWPNTKWLGQIGTPSHIALGGAVRFEHLRWLRKWKEKRSLEKFLGNLESAHLLTQSSQHRLDAIAAETKIEFERTEGLLQIVSSAAELVSLNEKLTFLKDHGVVARQISAEDIPTVEPALKLTPLPHCAIHFPGDRVGNCRQFALALKRELQLMGVGFKFNADLRNIESKPKLSLRFLDGTEHQDFDHVVLCTGAGARHLLNTLHIKLPMATIASYSLTARIREGVNAPKSAVFDTGNRTTIARLGNRVRVSCGAELGGANEKQDKKTVQHLYRALQQSYPGAADFSGGLQVWKGTFGVMHDGLPVIGQSAIAGVWLNLGHGPNGWGMACGAAQSIANAICNRPPHLALENFSPQRFY